MSFNARDIIKFNDGTFGALIRKIEHNTWEVKTNIGNKILSEESFVKFDKNESVTAIRVSLKDVNFEKLEKTNVDCKECLQLITLLKNLTSDGEISNHGTRP